LIAVDEAIADFKRAQSFQDQLRQQKAILKSEVSALLNAMKQLPCSGRDHTRPDDARKGIKVQLRHNKDRSLKLNDEIKSNLRECINDKKMQVNLVQDEITTLYKQKAEDMALLSELEALEAQLDDEPPRSASRSPSPAVRLPGFTVLEGIDFGDGNNDT
jgi:hypothetical protein